MEVEDSGGDTLAVGPKGKSDGRAAAIEHVELETGRAHFDVDGAIRRGDGLGESGAATDCDGERSGEQAMDHAAG
jgi:hypothetical protein